MRRPWVLLSVTLLVGCATAPGPTADSQASASISCQPYGYTPAPIAFSSPPGPVSATEAEETAASLVRACQSTMTIADLSSSATAASGMKLGPNAGQAVWRVEVAATVTDTEHPPGDATYQSYFLIEVNQATGVPTLLAYG